MKTIRLKKSLGQNLLIDKNQIRKIMDSVSIKKTDTILEIGPGEGAITIEIAKKAKKVIAIEKDKEMVEALESKLGNIKNVEVINKDILDLFNDGKLEIKEKKYKVVANIPYYLTSVLIRNLLEIKNPPDDIFLMIQREVGKRICSKPGDMSILSIAVQYYATPKILFIVPKGCFLPAPKVDSVFIQITPKGIKRNDGFFEVVKAGFSHPRKQLISNLSKELKIDREVIGEWLIKRKLKDGIRAESLSLEDWNDFYSSEYKGKSIKERG